MGFLINNSKGTKVIAVKGVDCVAPNISTILPPMSWKGKTCFIFGGGPSLKGFNFNLVNKYPTIGVNKAFVEFPTTLNYSMDSRFFTMVTYPKSEEEKKLHEVWMKYPGIKVFLRRSKKAKFDKNVFVVTEIARKVLSFDLSQGIYCGNNSGFGALMIAICLGCTRIGLLGYDLKTKEDRSGKPITHWHEGYEVQNKKTFQSKLDKFRMCIEEFSNVIKQRGVEVVNLSPDSALGCFPKSSLDEFLKESKKR